MVDLSPGRSSSRGSDQLAEAVETLRVALDRFSKTENRSGSAQVDAKALDEAKFVQTIINLRRIREKLFGFELFSDPAWDVLLELHAASLSGHPVSISRLCAAAQVPATTALRWIHTMSEAGILVRETDTQDKRRAYMRLSPQAAESMGKLIATMAASLRTAL